MNPTKRAKIKATGKTIYVYKLLLGGWCDVNDHETTYLDSQLEILED